MHGLVDRRPTVSPERLIAQLIPPPTFAEVSFATYRPDPEEPTQAAAVTACQEFCRPAVECRAGRRSCLANGRCCPVLPPGRRVRCGQDPPAGLGVLPVARRRAGGAGRPDYPKAFATFGS
jgi:cell division protein ZapE